jgi:gliding motility-associated-like protein
MVNDLNDTDPNISYHTGEPADASNEVTDPVVSPSSTTGYIIHGVNEFGCFDDELFLLFIDDPVFAGDDGEATLCEGTFSVNFYDYLNGVNDFSGEWIDVNDSGVNLNNPFNVNLSELEFGSYTYIYHITSDNTCPDDESSLVLEIVPAPTAIIDSVYCEPGAQFYSVALTTDETNQVGSNEGVINQNGMTVTITTIPIDENLFLSIIDNETGCLSFIPINPPDCNCPLVEPPFSDGDQEICFGETVPTLSVSVGADAITNWYDAASGGNLLIAASLSYTPSVTDPGTYIFYVEAESISEPGCVSSLRIAVQLTIYDLPEANTIVLERCDQDLDGFSSFDLESAKLQISSNTAVNIEYYETEENANTQSNPLSSPYVNSTAYQQTIYALVTDGNGCLNSAEVDLLVHDVPVFDVEVNNDICFGDSTSSVILHYGDFDNATQYSLDGINWQTDSVFSLLTSGNHTAYVLNSFGCQSEMIFSVEDGLDMNLFQFAIECSDNGTESNSSDDSYVIIFELQNNKGNTQTFDLLVGGVFSNSYNYNSIETIEIPADGSQIDLEFIDQESGCSIVQAIGPLNPCSTNCAIEFDLFTIECDDNGTESSSNDDFYTITINASALNGSGTNTFDILVDGNLLTSYMYGEINSFILPADGSSPLITIVDGEDGQCSNSMSIGPLETCSQKCVLDVTIYNISCEDPGTIDDAMDDVFYFNIIPNGTNTSSGWTISGDISTSGNYGDDLILGPYLISDGSLIFDLTDNDSLDCKVSLAVDPPEPCSAPCDDDVNAGPDQKITCLIDSVLLDGTMSSTGNGIFYSWTGINGELISSDISFYTDSAGIYFLQVLDTNNDCVSDFDAVEVVSNTNQPIAVIYAEPTDILDCFVQSIELSTDEQENVIHIWKLDNEEFYVDILSIFKPGLVLLEVIDTISGCSDLDSIEITDLQSYPFIELEPVDSLSCTVNQISIDGSGSQQGTNIVFNWYNGLGMVWADQGPILDVMDAGWYFFESIDTINGCTNVDSIYVDDITELPMVISGADVTLPCEEIATSLSIDILGNLGDYNISWQAENGGIILSGDGSPEIQVEGPGSFIVEVLNPFNGCAFIDTIEVENNTNVPELALLDIDSVSCFGQLDGSISITDVQGGLEPFTILVNGNSTNLPLNDLGPGTYELEIIDANGCSLDTTITLEEGTFIELFLDPELQLNFGDDGILEGIVNLDISLLSLIQWTPPINLSCDTCLITAVEGILGGTYTLTVVTVDGCEASASIRLIVIDDINIYVPNVFSPNDDGINEGFTLFADDGVERILKMDIFDRWGERVFEKPDFAPNQPGEGWDGTFRDQLIEQGVYVYLFEVLLKNGSTQLIFGDVTVLR